MGVMLHFVNIYDLHMLYLRVASLGHERMQESRKELKYVIR